MKEKVGKKRSTRTDHTSRGKSKRGEVGAKNLKPNLAGRPDKRHCFTDALRAELTKRKKFRRADGTLMEASELELIALKVIRELRTSPEINPKLLNIILDRIEGKAKELVEIDARIEGAASLDAKEILLQRIERIVGQIEEESAE